MNKIIKRVALFGVLLWSFGALAADIKVEGAWARATAPGQDSGMAELIMTSAQDAKLIGFSSTACKTGEMHSMTHDNGMMQMREVKFIALPAGHRVDLSEGGYHLMLVGLNAPLKAGESVPLKLIFKVDNKIVSQTVNAPIKPLTEAAHEHMHH
ncbi:MAG: copper chaperone PCu(A)C [Gallionella sp.]|nr:copper chaperone PCu(A)C [Gallionella sp.]